MRFETVPDSVGLDFRVNAYVNQGYKIESKDDIYVTLVKNYFNLGFFFLILFFILPIIGGLIYLAIKYGEKDVVITVGEISEKNQPKNKLSNVIKKENKSSLCPKCGYDNDNYNMFCTKCVEKLK